MKKITIILVTLFLICGMSALSFAKTSRVKTGIIRGEIVSIDAGKNEIVVKGKTIVVAPEVISSLRVGERVKVTLKAGSNVAASVNELVKKPASTKK